MSFCIFPFFVLPVNAWPWKLKQSVVKKHSSISKYHIMFKTGLEPLNELCNLGKAEFSVPQFRLLYNANLLHWDVVTSELRNKNT